MPGGSESPDPLPPLRETIAKYGLSPRKSLGQHFLLDLNLTRRIARAAGPLDATIYEVGPGPGGLTRALLMEGASRVIAVERDTRCLAALDEVASAYPGRLETIAADALVADETELLPARNIAGAVRIAANLPYNVGSALVVKWLAGPQFWQSMTVMLQREVAERLTALPATKSYGRLSVLAQWRAMPRILFDVPPQAFAPPPRVMSSVLRCEPLPTPLAPARLVDLEAVTKAAFGQRRKMLRQSLKTLTADTEALVRAAGLDPTRRAEHLGVAEFAALARAYRTMVEAASPLCEIGECEPKASERAIE